MKVNFSCLLLLATLVSISSCQKDEGEGGRASIIGYVHLTVVDIINNPQASYDGADQEVHIIYGDDISYGGRIRSGPDGKFEFKYLRKGNYKVYVYSDDNNPIGVFSPDTAIMKSVEITSKKQTLDAGTFEIIKLNN